MGKLVFGRYDYAACLIFFMYSMCSIVVPMTLVPLAADLGFPLADGGMALGGALQLGRSIPMVAAMALCGFASGIWGKRRTLGVTILLMAVGIMTAAVAPGYGVLFLALAISGLGEGVIEGLATPLVLDLHPADSGRYLNISHSFWSLGVIILTLAAGGLLYAGVNWRHIVFAVGVLAAVPTLLLLWPDANKRYQDHADKSHWREVIRNTVAIVGIRRFWLFFAAMFFAGGAEFCLTFWCASFIQLEFGGAAWAAGAGTAVFSAGMFAGRVVPGYFTSQKGLKPLMLVLAAVGAAAGCLFPFLTSLTALFVLLFVSGFACGPFWPSIQSDGAHRIEGDNTMLMILFSCAGVPGSGFFAALTGYVGDHAGLRMSFFLVPLCLLLVFALLGLDWLAERKEPPDDKPHAGIQSTRLFVKRAE